MDIKKLRRLAEKTKGFTKADKEWLLPILEELEIDAPTKNNCPSCWRDAAVMALVKVKESKAQHNGFRLKGTAATVGVFWMGRFVSPATLDDEMIVFLKSTNFPKHQYDED